LPASERKNIFFRPPSPAKKKQYESSDKKKLWCHFILFYKFIENHVVLNHFFLFFFYKKNNKKNNYKNIIFILTIYGLIMFKILLGKNKKYKNATKKHQKKMSFKLKNNIKRQIK